MASLYITRNSAMNTTAPPTLYDMDNAADSVRTMLQLAPASGKKIKIIGWGYTLLAAPANNIKVELFTTDVAASGLTAHVAAGIQPYNDAGSGASALQLGTALTGYSVGSDITEGSITATRTLDWQCENGLYYKMRFELGREPEVGSGTFLRIRATPTAAVVSKMSCYVIHEES